MKVMENSPSERYAECLDEGVEIDLEDKHMVWFDEEHEKQSKSESLVRTPVTIPPQANVGNTGKINQALLYTNNCDSLTMWI